MKQCFTNLPYEDGMTWGLPIPKVNVTFTGYMSIIDILKFQQYCRKRSWPKRSPWWDNLLLQPQCLLLTSGRGPFIIAWQYFIYLFILWYPQGSLSTKYIVPYPHSWMLIIASILYASDFCLFEEVGWTEGIQTYMKPVVFLAFCDLTGMSSSRLNIFV